MRGLSHLAIVLVAGAIAGTAGAQDRPSGSNSSDIIVEGVRERERNREIQLFIEALTPVPANGQIARFNWEVCPAAVGLLPAQNDAIVARMRQVARAAGVPLASADCRPNTLVIAAPDKRELMRQMRRRYPGYFMDANRRAFPIPDEPGPVAAWHVSGRLAADGTAVPVTEEGVYVVSTADAPSRLRAASRPHFISSIVILELGGLTGLTTTQVADYAAMRAFAHTVPSRLSRSAAPTILDVIDTPLGDPTPVTLTAWDLGFLRALYGSSENNYRARQRHEMQRLVREDLQQAEQE